MPIFNLWRMKDNMTPGMMIFLLIVFGCVLAGVIAIAIWYRK